MPRMNKPSLTAAHKHLTPSTVIASLALVLAMTGGAYAASKYLITKTSQIKPSVLKSLQGKTGHAGPAGPAGAPGAGSQGPAGAGGAKGETGAAGAAGTNGTNGKDGKNGEKGATGSPWTAGGTLPSGETEQGDWSLAATATATGQRLTSSISFVIPLAAPLTNAEKCGTAGKPACLSHFIKEGGTPPSACPGTVQEPKAEAGNLCVFVKQEENTEPHFGFLFFQNPEGTTEESLFNATGKVGTNVEAQSKAAGPAFAYGTWAVTAP
jgi:hypothetical protein